jgi:hypothetical protein
VWDLRIARRHQLKEVADILHVRIKRGNMSACTARSAVTAQVEAGYGVSGVCHCFANMSEA